MTFIRGPIIREVDKDVDVLAIVNDQIVAAREKKYACDLISSWIDNDVRLHQYFIDMCK